MIDSKILKFFIPFIGTMLIVCGFIKLNIIYNHFDIGINNYLEFSEIITLFLPDILRSSMLILLVLFIVYLIISMEKIDRNTEEHQEFMITKSAWRRFKLFFKKYQFLGTWSIMIFVTTIILMIWFPNKLYDYILANAIIPAIFIFNWLSYEFKRKYNLIHENKMNSSHSMLTFLIFIFFAFTMNSAFSEIKSIKKK